MADMNNDGNLDIVVANHQSPYLRAFLGDGHGGFRRAPDSPVDVHSNPHPHAVVVADFDSNGKLDVAIDSWRSNEIDENAMRNYSRLHYREFHEGPFSDGFLRTWPCYVPAVYMEEDSESPYPW